MISSENTIPNKKDLSVSMAKANILSVYFAIPVLLLAALYFLVWGWDSSFAMLSSLKTAPNVLWMIVGVFAGVIVHELLHGIAWMYFADKKSGQIKFGFNWKTLTPFAHCTEPMEIIAYCKGAAAPGVILGVIPYLIGLIAGNPVLAIYGLFFCFAASGDALILWLLRKVESGKLVEDHPTRTGCYVLE